MQSLSNFSFQWEWLKLVTNCMTILQVLCFLHNVANYIWNLHNILANSNVNSWFFTDFCLSLTVLMVRIKGFMYQTKISVMLISWAADWRTKRKLRKYHINEHLKKKWLWLKSDTKCIFVIKNQIFYMEKFLSIFWFWFVIPFKNFHSCVLWRCPV